MREKRMERVKEVSRMIRSSRIKNERSLSHTHTQGRGIKNEHSLSHTYTHKGGGK